MRKIIAHDTVNDVALIEAGNHYYVRYQLEYAEHYDLASALAAFGNCVDHAIKSEGRG